MPFSFDIRREPNYADIQRMMVKELGPRVRAVQKEIVKSISQNVLDGVREMAPAELGGYEKDLHNVGLTGDHVIYAVKYERKIEKGKDKDPLTTLLYLRTGKRKLGKWNTVFRILADYGPFTLETWPLKIPKNKAMIFYRDSAPGNVKRITAKNRRQSQEMISKLRESGVRLSKSDFTVNKDKLDILDDLAFKVVRVEKGIQGIKAQPHWRPALKEAKTSNSLEQIKSRNRDIEKTLYDPNFRRWTKLGKINEKISPAELQEIYAFQQIIAGVKK